MRLRLIAGPFLASLPLFAALSQTASGQVFDPLYPFYLTQNLYAYCESGGYLVPSGITLSTGMYDNSNGHFHSSTPATLSTVWPEFVWTGENGQGYSEIALTTTGAGRAEYIEVCISFPYPVCTIFDYGVGLWGLTAVDGGVFMQVGGGTTGHGGNEYNHWMDAASKSGILNATIQYKDAHENEPEFIAINDMSLPWGGKFDIYQNWTSPHAQHDWGTAVDVRGNGGPGSVPAAHQGEFRDNCTDNGAVVAIIESQGTPNQHIHCAWTTASY